MTKMSEEGFVKLDHLSGHSHRLSEIMHDLDSPQRREALPPKEILNLAAIQPNDIIIELGAGTGYFTLPAAKMTAGKVIAIDANPKMLEYIQEKAQEQGITNLNVMTALIETVQLEDDMADVVIASLVLHEVESLSIALQQVHRILKKDGRFLCVELEPEQIPTKAPRISSEDLERALNQAGFKVIKRYFPVESNYCFVSAKS